jgi:MoxR-like ATPase
MIDLRNYHFGAITMQSPAHATIQRTIATLADAYLPGKERTLQLAFVALLAGGHLLLEDIPGQGKTTLAVALAAALGLSFGRVQCTSDLLPGDITGMSIYDREEQRFTLHPGPIFNHVVLVDELNRAMPKTQSALLEAMEERRVTIDGITHDLPDPFLVIATQNPLEQVGTYPLPESQLDRFLVRTDIGYPSPELEQAIFRQGSNRAAVRSIIPLITRGDIMAARQSCAQVFLAEQVTAYLHALITATRNHPMLLAGVSTRGGICLADAARVWAYLDQRDYVAPSDIQQMVVPVCAHRLVVRPEYAAIDREELLRGLIADIPAPR